MNTNAAYRLRMNTNAAYRLRMNTNAAYRLRMNTNAAYRCLGLTILRLDVATLAAELGGARSASSAQVSTTRLPLDRRPAQLRKLSAKVVRRPEQLVA
jgi:hypothetical protein